MKNLPLIILVFISIISFVSCAKDKNQPQTPTTPVTNVNKGSFSWLAVPGSSVTADSSYFFSQITTIYAFKNGYGNSVEINLSDLTVGSYSFSSVTGNDFTYVLGSATYTAHSGSCQITAAANNRLSGSFTVNLSGGAINSMTGAFTDILKK